LSSRSGTTDYDPQNDIVGFRPLKAARANDEKPDPAPPPETKTAEPTKDELDDEIPF
jgi:hypothetical protein